MSVSGFPPISAMSSSGSNPSVHSSQYGGDIYKVLFGVGEASWVHSPLLKHYPQLMDRVYDTPRDPWPCCLDMKDIGHDIGHPIIHFLYTGTYQCLEYCHGKAVSSDGCQLSVGLHVCITADNLQIAQLRKLAVEEVKRVSDKLSLQFIFETFEFMEIKLEQVPVFNSYLQERIRDAKFGAPGQSFEDVLAGLCSTNTLSTLVLRRMVLKQLQEDKKARLAKANHGDSKTDDRQSSPPVDVPSGLLLLERQIAFLVLKEESKGESATKEDQEVLKSLQEASSVVCVLRNALSNKKTPAQSIPESKGKGAVEAWLDRDPESKPSPPGSEANEDDASAGTSSTTEMTPSSNGSSWGVLEDQAGKSTLYQGLGFGMG